MDHAYGIIALALLFVALSGLLGHAIGYAKGIRAGKSLRYTPEED